jgi:hypothetical protein
MQEEEEEEEEVCKKTTNKSLWSHHLLATIPSILPHFINRQDKKEIDRWRQDNINQKLPTSSSIFLFLFPSSSSSSSVFSSSHIVCKETKNCALGNSQTRGQKNYVQLVQQEQQQQPNTKKEGGPRDCRVVPGKMLLFFFS